MCGIAGFCDTTLRSDERALRRMTQALAHRGPDDRGHALFDSDTARIGLGHRRLSILDVSSHGHQPMTTRDDRYAITYNGEIYNFREVREALDGPGVSFDSECDTEVLLQAWASWGPACLDRLIGMFALAIYDREQAKLWLVRDRAGVKPLYFYWKNGLLLFGSELKTLRAHEAFPGELDEGVIATFLRYGYIPSPHTIYRHTEKLRPGHFLEVDIARQQLKQTRYWSVIDCYNEPKSDMTDVEAEEELEALLRSAFQYRLVSDVPVGLFLSGGYDSSAVAALLQSEMTDRLKTFTIGFREDAFDEAPHARRVADHLGTDHVEHYCSREDAAEIIPRLPEIYDEPFGDSSAIPTVLVSELACQDVKVALSADGGDETFAGYVKYTSHLDLYARIASLPRSLRRALHPLVGPLARLPGIRDIAQIEGRAEVIQSLLAQPDEAALYRHKIEPRYFTNAELSRILVGPAPRLATAFDDFALLGPGNDPIDRMLAIDYQTYLVDDILTKVDRATMSVGLEGREPLLDHRIIELAARLPSAHKYNGGVQKVLLRNILHKHVPRQLVERPKMGFAVPVGVWLRDTLRDLLMTYLDENRLAPDGLFDPRAVVALRDRYLEGDAVPFEKCWHLLVFEMWKERWL